jgi:hypothetical protein
VGVIERFGGQVLEIEKLRSSKALRTGLLICCLAIISYTGFSELYIRFHYAEVMPRSPQPETGRIYAMPAQYGGIARIPHGKGERRIRLWPDQWQISARFDGNPDADPGIKPQWLRMQNAG